MPAHEAARLYARPDPCLLLDVRTPMEYREVHIEGALLVPLDELRPDEFVRQHQQVESCVVICRGGSRARKAAEKLVSAGLSGVAVLEGGMQAWEGAGLPVRRGVKVISLDRQVRIAIGSLVLLGAVLGRFVHPGGYGLCAFMGAGLIFSGVADFCGLALILAKAPWNKGVPDPSCHI